MAKHKSATALFEVINKSRQSNRGLSAQNASFGPIASWFGRRHGSAVKPSAAAVAPPLQAAVAPDLAPAAIPDTQRDTPREEQPPQLYHRPERAQSIAVALDSERRQVSLRMSYATTVIAAFSVLVVVGLAVVVGQHLSRGIGPAPTGLPSTPTLQAGPAHPEVLGIKTTPLSAIADGRDTHGQPTVIINGPGGATGSPPPTTGGGTSTLNEPRPPAPFVVQDAKRTLGLNYVVVQSYPEEKMAQEAVDFLAKHQIPCTIERELPRWGKGYIVVGIDGFRSPSSPEYKDYVAKIEQLSDQFAGNKSFKAFRPGGYKWDKTGT